MYRPQWSKHGCLKREKPAQILVPHDDQSCHRLVWDGKNTQLNDCINYTCYPLPQQIVFDRSTNFMDEFDKICQNDYGLKRKPITTRNPHFNAIIKRIHQTIGNIIRTFEVSNIINNYPWSGILAATMFAIRSTYHKTIQASPMQLVFGQDAILNFNHVA